MANTAWTARMGMDRGMTTLRKVRNLEQPSISLASTRSWGMLFWK